MIGIALMCEFHAVPGTSASAAAAAVLVPSAAAHRGGRGVVVMFPVVEAAPSPSVGAASAPTFGRRHDGDGVRI